MDKILLRKRAVIESVNDPLKSICQIEHLRHRSRFNFLVNLFAGLVAYCHHPQKPSLDLMTKAYKPCLKKFPSVELTSLKFAGEHPYAWHRNSAVGDKRCICV